MPFHLDSEDRPLPSAHSANEQGLVAWGGRLTLHRLEEAYSKGIFPWFDDASPILWWSPDPRMVLYPNKLHIPKSMRPLLHRGEFQLTINHSFSEVIRACAKSSRPDQDGTWITNEIIDAYTQWHEMGFVHSFEAWKGDDLVGGFYGVNLGSIFYGESMFTKVPNASKFAFIKAVQWMEQVGISIIDCQMETEHLKRFGAQNVAREFWLTEMEKGLIKNKVISNRRQVL